MAIRIFTGPAASGKTQAVRHAVREGAVQGRFDEATTRALRSGKTVVIDAEDLGVDAFKPDGGVVIVRLQRADFLSKAAR